jgi:hypothetical protein
MSADSGSRDEILRSTEGRAKREGIRNRRFGENLV